MQTYKTRDGDVLDEILWRHYGTANAATMRHVFDANPTLAEQPAVMQAGVTIVLPDIDHPTQETVSVSLWD